MPTIINAQPFDFLGSAWSLWPPHSKDGELNLVEGVRCITANILSLSLTKKGENHQHPDYGIAPELFENLSGYAPQYFVYEYQTELRKWIGGIQSLRVDLKKFLDYENQIAVQVGFVPMLTADTNILTFGYYDYVGAIATRDYTTFIKSISLSQSFQPLGG